jgi:exo-1,4-beta-D-glucosaminidase
LTITPEQYPQLKLTHPRLWWPYQMGTPALNAAKISFEIAGQASDSTSFQFGIREVKSELTEKGYRLFSVNGRKVLVRGAADAPDMLLRFSQERMQAGLDYVRDMGLNTIRLEGRMNRAEFFDATDRMGILVMPGWTCCDAWEKWENWGPEQHEISVASMADQARRLRNHSSVFVWLYGSDGPPPADVEQAYLNVLHDQRWPNPAISSASATPTTLTGNSGVKMTGPYEYVPPNYWLVDSQAGGAYGYNTETSPGEAIPTLESLKRFIPADHLWPIDEYWNYHAGLERFTNIDVFTNAMNSRYGAATDLNDYERKAQAMAYEGERAMFEAYGRNKYTSTGVIQWMLNNGWPSLIWHLYDYYLVPAGGYFGTKKAMEMAHVQYSYDDNSVAVVNSYNRPLQNVKVSAALYSPEGMQIASKTSTINVDADSTVKVFDLPQPASLNGAYFLKLRLEDSTGRQLSDNFYWLSTKPDQIDFAERKDTVYTPQSAYADLTALNGLQPGKLVAVKRTAKAGKSETIHVSIHNSGKNIAFLVHLRITQGANGEDVVPIFWSDNYVSLLPGEQREIAATFDSATLNGKPAVVHLDGWNLAERIVAEEKLRH